MGGFKTPPGTNSGATFTGTTTITGPLAHTGSTAGFYGVAPVARAGAITAPNAPGAVYAQADAQSAVAAINSIRAALTALGLTS